jgi:uncharacterized protein YbcC (UPF0753/DUF2309 family)
MTAVGSGSEPLSVGERVVVEALADLSHVLPQQAPITRFVHHNTLHAFEELPFESAVRTAGRRLDAQAYLDAETYEAAVASGRIEPCDVDEALEELDSLGLLPKAPPDGPELPARFERLQFFRDTLLRPAPRLVDECVEWWMAESAAFERPWSGCTPTERAHLIAAGSQTAGGIGGWLRELWTSCGELHATSLDAGGARLPRDEELDELVARGAPDPCDAVAGAVVPFLAAYLDQGVAYWPMPDRDGLWRSFVRYFGAVPRLTWAPRLHRELPRMTDDRPITVAVRELESSGLPLDAWVPRIERVLLAMRGWAGMVSVVAQRPDLAPTAAPPMSLEELLALALVLLRAAMAHARTQLGPAAAVGLGDAQPPCRGLSRRHQRFIAAQRCGLAPEQLRGVHGVAWCTVVDAFDFESRRAVWHRAYELHLRRRAFAAIVARRRDPWPEDRHVDVALLCCMDEREESWRRAVERIDPRVRTYGVAGHFDVFMEYVPLVAARSQMLCPPHVDPSHVVSEIGPHERGRDAVARALPRWRHGEVIARKTLVRGTLWSLTGALTSAPLILRTLFPERLARATARVDAPSPSLAVSCADGPALELGHNRTGLIRRAGFTTAEQAKIVAGVVSVIGLSREWTPLVLIAGHGSTSVNNPHASAYNCGACSGGRGGPNARVFAMMANDPDVRAAMPALGVEVPPSTWFVALEHDTATDDVTWYDTDRVPDAHRPRLAVLVRTLDEAGSRSAMERCRRFPDAPLATLRDPARARMHVRTRAVDFAQPRPEYCHATNALAVIGRRAVTRGLFFDRRAFLISYDPAGDDEHGSVLERLLAAVTPVGAGINLEYYFSRVDPRRYGAGTKLPHNVTGLLGVMDGHRSDLRSGLHRQTVEIHEPVRLLLVVEQRPAVLSAIADRNRAVGGLVRGRWVQLAALDPDSEQLWSLTPEGFALWSAADAPDALVPTIADDVAHANQGAGVRPFARVPAPMVAPRSAERSAAQISLTRQHSADLP